MAHGVFRGHTFSVRERNVNRECAGKLLKVVMNFAATDHYLPK